MTLRKTLFWIHLGAGSIAGIVILIMSITGVLLAYERQINVWVNREYRSAPPYPGASRLPAGTLLGKVCAVQPINPSNVILHSQPELPVEIAYGQDRTEYFDSYTGNPIGLASQKARNFFRRVEDWHRWLGASPQNRALWRTVTGVCNAAFFVLVSTGLFLWWPKSWTLPRLKAAITWRWGQPTARARNWNWHTVTGFWCAAPLLIIVLCGIVMSFPWANNLLYRITGNDPPAQGQRAPAATADSMRAQAGRGGQDGGRAPSATMSTTPGAPERTRGRNNACSSWDTNQVNNLWDRAEAQVSDWRIISLRPPASAAAPAVFSIDRGNGGRPDKRAQLTLNWQTGAVVLWEPFSSYNMGRRMRAWVRFSHTGEAGGIPGQTIAALATAGTTVLVFTGLAMAWKRFLVRWWPASQHEAAKIRPGDGSSGARAEQSVLRS